MDPGRSPTKIVVLKNDEILLVCNVIVFGAVHLQIGLMMTTSEGHLARVKGSKSTGSGTIMEWFGY